MIEFSVRRPISILCLSISIVVLGFISYEKIPVELMPVMNIPEFKIQIDAPAMTSEEIEETTVIPLERSISTVSGLRSTISRSFPGRAEIELKFANSIEIPATLSELKDRIDSTGIPEGVRKPRVKRFQSTNSSVLEFVVVPLGDFVQLGGLKDEIEETLKRDLEQIDGVALVNILGAPEPFISIKTNPLKMQALAITSQNLFEAISGKFKVTQLGQVDTEAGTFPIKLGHTLEAISQLESVPVRQDGKATIRVSNVASVSLENETLRTIRVNSKPALLVNLQKEAEANTVKVGDAVKETIASWIQDIASRAEVFEMTNQAHEISIAVENVESSVVTGAILAALIIYLLLQSAWTSFIISIAIPMSLMFTLILMHLNGVTFNLMSLAGLALGVGMLVDNSTVVLESIFDQQKSTVSKMEAAIHGARSVGPAVTASTLSTIAVFAPLVFIDGPIGFLFKDVALTVCFSIFSSLIAALILVPCLCSLNVPHVKIPDHVLTPGLNFFNPSATRYRKILTILNNYKTCLVYFTTSVFIFATNTKMTKTYFWTPLTLIHDKLVATSLRLFHGFEHWVDQTLPYWLSRTTQTSVLFLVSVSTGILLMLLRGTELFPEEQLNKIVYDFRIPNFYSLPQSTELMRSVEKQAIALSSVKNIVVDRPNRLHARLTVFSNPETLQQTSDSILQILQKIPELSYEKKKLTAFEVEKPIQILLVNDDLKKLRQESAEVRRIASTLSGFEDITSSLSKSYDQIVVKVDSSKLHTKSIDLNTFVGIAKTLLDVGNFGKLNVGGRALDLQIKAETPIIRTSVDVGHISFETEDKRRNYLGQISEIKAIETPEELVRVERRRTAIVSANLFGIDLGEAANLIKSKLSKVQDWRFGGQKEQQERSQRELLLAILFSIGLIYLITASQYENLTLPIAILVAVPLSIPGLGLFLWIFNLNLSSLVFVGFIILVGTSVNTSIVLVDVANSIYRQTFNAKEAILNATKARIKPIVVTTLANILGLIPMALSAGEPGSSMQQPLAVTLIGGLISSTLLTLIIIPALYIYLMGLKKDARHAH